MSPPFPGDASDQLPSDEVEVIEGELLLPEDDELEGDGAEGYVHRAAAAHARDSDEDEQAPEGEVIEVLSSTLPVVRRSTGLAARDPLQAYMQVWE